TRITGSLPSKSANVVPRGAGHSALAEQVGGGERTVARHFRGVLEWDCHIHAARTAPEVILVTSSATNRVQGRTSFLFQPATRALIVGADLGLEPRQAFRDDARCAQSLLDLKFAGLKLAKFTLKLIDALLISGCDLGGLIFNLAFDRHRSR